EADAGGGEDGGDQIDDRAAAGPAHRLPGLGRKDRRDEAEQHRRQRRRMMASRYPIPAAIASDVTGFSRTLATSCSSNASALSRRSLIAASPWTRSCSTFSLAARLAVRTDCSPSA